MTPEQAAELRKPFPPEQIGKLPKTTCRACSDSQSKVCGDHTKQKCPACGNYITNAHVDLDYVGHAATTERLLQVDPEWSWEPFATDANGAPLFVDRGLWIRLTVLGVTRPGYGDGKSVKECIGDAIRNAAMRFGVALDLWAKEPLAEGQDEPAPTPAQTRTAKLRTDIAEAAKAKDIPLSEVASDFQRLTGQQIQTCEDEPTLAAYLKRIQTGEITAAA